MGVTFNKIINKYQARVQFKGCNIYLGSFENRNRADEVFKRHDEKYKRILEREQREWERSRKLNG